MAIKGVGKGYYYQEQAAEKPQANGNGSFYESLAAVSDMTTEQLMQEIGNKKNEIYEKVKKGELEESFQIGGQSFTLKEWNKLLESFDSAQDKLKALLEEKLEQQKKADIEAANRAEDHNRL
ncbi:MAG: hypothetical protein K2H52_00455 [Lachnospiraceae bacterium]|nr:hypothetical protein [Lachnospiraceae bacterium]MDE6186185.1 hypothetical protein [Lachnospiraceae bacterium]